MALIRSGQIIGAELGKAHTWTPKAMPRRTAPAMHMFILVHLAMMIEPTTASTLLPRRMYRLPQRSLALAIIGLMVAVPIARDSPSQIVLPAPPTIWPKNLPFYERNSTDTCVPRRKS